MIREAKAALRGKPDISGLQPEMRDWVVSSCSDLLGPSLTISCLTREKAALANGLPNISNLTEEQQEWVLESCTKLLGPSLYISCIKRESNALRSTTTTTKQLSASAKSIPPDVQRGNRNYQAILDGQMSIEQLSPQELQEVLDIHNALENRTGGGGCSGAIESQIEGTFEGWSGDTIFKLTNGQIWQQASYAYTYHYAYRPEVIIYAGKGGCRLKVDGVSESIFVRRLN